jgi:hypothetical protein
MKKFRYRLHRTDLTHRGRCGRNHFIELNKMVASLPAHRPSARRKNACSIFAAGPKEVKSRRRRLFVVF